MIRACGICGQEMNDYFMDCYNTGRTQIWLCPECRKNARREVDRSEAIKKRARMKEKEKR